jgi:hypothetical protein
MARDGRLGNRFGIIGKYRGTGVSYLLPDFHSMDYLAIGRVSDARPDRSPVGLVDEVAGCLSLNPQHVIGPLLVRGRQLCPSSSYVRVPYKPVRTSCT